MIGCGMPVGEGDVSLAEASERSGTALDVIDHARVGLDLLGLSPSHTCGEPTSSFVGRALEGVEARFECATAAVAAESAADALTVRFDAGGCEVEGVRYEGEATFRIGRGEDRLDVSADLRELTVDGERVGAEAGYSQCGDDERVWANASGVLDDDETSYSVSLDVLRRPGFPLISPSRWLVDGEAEVVDAQGLVGVRARELLLEGGGVPVRGTLELDVRDHLVVVTFDRDGSVFEREATIQIDDGEARRAPVL